MEKYIPVIIAIISSSAFCEVVKYFVNRSKYIRELNSLKTTIDNLALQIRHNQAEQARIRILRFDDDIYTKNYSQDFYRQTLADIKTYENYCLEDKTYENGYTSAAAKHIRAIYEDKLKHNDFR